jgi:hypothetical protein
MKILRYIALVVCVVIAMFLLRVEFPVASNIVGIISWIFLAYLIAPKK